MTKTGSQKTEIRDKVLELESLVETISRGKMMWEATFDVITDPVVIINRKYEIVRANKALAGACQMDIRKTIGQLCYKIFAGCDAPCSKCPVHQTLASHESHSAELEIFSSKRRQYFVNAYSMSGIQNDEELIVLHYRDITDEKQLQRQLIHSDKMAAVGTLAGGVAHEINNPLGGILAFAQLVMRELGPDHSCYDDLKEIEDASLRCKKIVRDLLDFSRQYQKEQMDTIFLNDLVVKTISIVKLNLKGVGVNLTLNLSDHLPPIQGDMHKLQQVLLNLCTNAIHSMKDHGGELTLSTRASSNGQRLFLDIKDTGVGIDKDDIDRIFDPYFTTKGQGEGTGLGLSICYKIMDEHQGKIHVDSQIGKGTSFTLEFKRCP